MPPAPLPQLPDPCGPSLWPIRHLGLSLASLLALLAAALGAIALGGTREEQLRLSGSPGRCPPPWAAPACRTLPLATRPSGIAAGRPVRLLVGQPRRPVGGRVLAILPPPPGETAARLAFTAPPSLPDGQAIDLLVPLGRRPLTADLRDWIARR